MLARLAILSLAAAAPALAQSAAPPAPVRVPIEAPPSPSVPPPLRVLSWQVSDVTCGLGTPVAPARLNAPLPTTAFLLPKGSEEPVSLAFDLDAEGRPFNIRNMAEKPLPPPARDLMPSLRASRFAVDAPLQDCRISYVLQSEIIAQASQETIAELGVALKLRIPTEAWDRIIAGDCRKSPRLAPLSRRYPDFRKLTRREGARQWVYVTYDIDADGVPVNLAVPLTSGYGELDAEARAAVAAGRYAGGPRSGCVQAWWTGAAKIPAPPIPPKSETRGNPACEIKDRWEREPRLTFPSSYLQRAIEGWAILRFDVAPWGDVGAIEVLAAQPSAEFGEAAVNVIKRARYKPQEGGLSGCVDRVIFRVRPDERDIADGAAPIEAMTD